MNVNESSEKGESHDFSLIKIQHKRERARWGRGGCGEAGRQVELE